ncbi:MAG: ABC transporter permease [Ruminiclostridium sp.]|nr:ABC transporter permease [Ruminiclostridium sp.]
MRFFSFASRNSKELLRDPLTLLFGIGLPLTILLMFSLMQKNLPFDLYNIENLTPGVAVFSFSFISLFSGMLIGRDRSSSFLIRLFASPLSASDYIIGYAFPLLPAAILQSAVCFFAAFFLGLPFSINALAAIIVLILIAMLYIGFGLLFGTLFTDKQVGGIFAIFVNATAWLSGTWFDLGMMGGAFKAIGYALPFAHAVDATRAALAGNISSVFPHLLWCIGYGAAIFYLAVWIFRKKMKG